MEQRSPTLTAADPDHAAYDRHGTPRIDYARVAPDALRARRGLEAYVRASGLEESLVDLVRLRASLINGCAYCVDMHTKDARLAGESEQRLYAVPVWRETPFFTPRERAALAWTEAVTELARTRVPDDVYAEAREQFDEAELVALTMAVVAINGWNRLAVSFRTPAGGYVAGSKARLAAQPAVAGDGLTTGHPARGPAAEPAG